MARRRPEPRILDPATHPRRTVCLAVAAEYLEIDRKTLATYLAEGLIGFEQRHQRRKIKVSELVAFEAREHRGRRAG